LPSGHSAYTSGLLQTVCRLFSVSWARMTFARMS
jgi:hypothetical protein